VEIVKGTSLRNQVIVVVSAMAGVTNKLILAAASAEAGDGEQVAKVFGELRQKHEAAINELISSVVERKRLTDKMGQLLHEGENLCQSISVLRDLTSRASDSISSLGERLSAPLVAAALAEQGVRSEAIDSTELIVTDALHGAAEPHMGLTRERCQARLRSLLNQGVVPVVTGFIGATAEGVLTTLGRGGSDYSATIVGSAVDADEIVIWTDVDGVMTADPRQVPHACPIPEISYREATELAYFGAKVLHPKTLLPLMQSETPVWIRNTFAPHREGTKITPNGSPNGGGIKALTAISDVALITVGGPGIAGLRDVLGRTFKTTAAVGADVLLISQSSSQNDICFLVPSKLAKPTVEALRREFAHDLQHEKVEHVTLDLTVAIVAAVGENLRRTPEIVGRMFTALGREKVGVIAISQGSSECNISFVVAQKDMKAALLTTHGEFELGALS
jgi:aspartate kinase